ncbi:MAG: V0D/AC39 family V-type ATPase subunit, partial [Planctomycetota bacterium]
MVPTSPQTNVPIDFLQAKLRGRRRRLYEGDRLEQLSDCTSVKELWNDLYPREKGAGRVRLQRHVRKDCITDLCSILYLLPEAFTPLYSALLRRFQLDNILVLMRLFAGGRKELDPEHFVPNLPEHIDVSPRRLLQARNLEGFIDRLPADLRSPADDTVDLYESETTTAFTEMALERGWWNLVLDNLADLSRNAREECAPPILFELNSARLLSTLRAARAYDIEWDAIHSYLPPEPPHTFGESRLRMSDPGLEALFESPEPEEVASQVAMLDRAMAGDLVELEHETWEKIIALANHLYYT